MRLSGCRCGAERVIGTKTDIPAVDNNGQSSSSTYICELDLAVQYSNSFGANISIHITNFVVCI